jgi:hypothetical protein
VSAIKQMIWKFQEQVRDWIVARPDLSYERIGEKFGVGEQVVGRIAERFAIKRKRGRKAAAKGN